VRPVLLNRSPLESSPTAQAPDDRVSYAMGIADGSYEWYKRHAIRCRKAFRFSETVQMLAAAAIPTSAVIMPASATVPAILGAVVVVLSGSRSVFHWQENYLRFSAAREAVEAQRRLYITRASPYDDEDTRDQLLAAEVTRIEQDEMRGWTEIAAAPPKPVST
jgi:hypothetical protein